MKWRIRLASKREKQVCRYSNMATVIRVVASATPNISTARPWPSHHANKRLRSTTLGTMLCLRRATRKRRKSNNSLLTCKASSHDNDDEEIKEPGSVHQEKFPSEEPDKNVTIPQEVEEQNTTSVASGSPLPGIKSPDEPMKLSKETLDVLKDQVFGFDTFFVTGQEPYEGGVMFKGNLRGDVTKSYTKVEKRLQDKFGDQYKLFLLTNPEDDRPVAVVIPQKSLQTQQAAVPEWLAASAFGALSLFTLLLRNAPALQINFLTSFGNIEIWKEGIPGFLITAAVLGAHEIGHLIVANSIGAQISVPYFIPSWQIGSFGAITRVTSTFSNRTALLQFAGGGPIVGYSLALLILILGFFLPPDDSIGLIVDASVFHDSFLVGSIAKLALGDVLKEGTKVAINPLVVWAWSGLLINAINSIPAGELDGGRIALALWGRKVWTRVSGLSIGLLGLTALSNDVSFYWVILILFLQRGPIPPQAEEISQPDQKNTIIGLTVLVLGLLICLPFPFPFSSTEEIMDML